MLYAALVDSQGAVLARSEGVKIQVDDPMPPLDPVKDLGPYDPSFETLGTNARDSMPLGNGDVALNAWTCSDGSVGLLIAKINALSGEANAKGFFSLRKIGRVKISFDPPVLLEAAESGLYRQTLTLADASIRFEGKGGGLKVWVDKNLPVIRAEWQGERPVRLTVRNDPWRTNEVAGTHLADVVFPGLKDQVAWCYHDPRTNTGYRNAHESGVLLAGLDAEGLLPELTTVSFGALLEGEGFRSVDPLTLGSPPRDRARIDIHIGRVSKQNAAKPEAWLRWIQAQAVRVRAVSRGEAWAEHRRWWTGYWERSALRITGGPDAEEVTRHMLMQRFMNACQAGAVRELWRIPFNGGLITTDLLDMDFGKGMGVNTQQTNTSMTPDYRPWGASDRPQNTRHVYGSMSLSGDDDQARAWLLWPTVVSPDWQATVEKNTGLHGAFMSVGCSGWESLKQQLFIPRRGQVTHRIIPEGIGKNNGGRGYCFDVADEYLPFMLDYWELSGDEDFMTNRLVPYAQGLFAFFDGYFTRDDTGRLVLWPAMASEAYVRYPTNGYVPANPTAGVALLHTELPRLLALKGRPGVPAGALALWKRLYEAKPDLPVAMRRNGALGLAPHEPPWDVEQKETQGLDRGSLYAIWPYRAILFPEAGGSAEEYALATNTLALDDNGSTAWRYGDYCAAILGLSGRARKGVLTRVKEYTKGFFRLPAFGLNKTDGSPNVEGGNVSLSTLQYMLWNWKGDTIYLCPAWPKDWDCEFKFRGPGHTMVKGRVKEGVVIVEQVIPPERWKDIVICPLK